MIEEEVTIIKTREGAFIKLSKRALQELHAEIGTELNLVVDNGDAFTIKIPTIEDMVNELDITKVKDNSFDDGFMDLSGIDKNDDT